MLVLTVALKAGIEVRIALILGITTSMTLLFILDRHLVFSHARYRDVLPQLIGFLIVCFVGGALNYLSAMALLSAFPGLLVQAAELVGIIVGTTFNYIFLRFLIFKK